MKKENAWCECKQPSTEKKNLCTKCNKVIETPEDILWKI